jgi:endonuclease-8
MPEGDTIHSAARKVGAVLVGQEIVEIETPHPRHALDRWPERLAGRAVRSVDAHGKHLFIRFEGELTLHSHLRMTGKWGVYRRGERWRRSPRRAWLVIRTAEHEVVEFDGPVLELMTESRTRFDRRLAALGPDLLSRDFDESRFLARLRSDDQSRGIGEALLDQRNLAGIGNMWKSEGCFLAGVDPWRRSGEVSDDEVLRVVRGLRPLMSESVERGGRGPERRWVFERSGLACRRCNTLIRARGQGDDNRTTYWCPACQG